MGKKILFLISESFPFGRAYAARTRALVKLFELAGNSVTVFCDEISAGDAKEDYHVLAPEHRQYSSITKLISYPRDYVNAVDKLLSEQKFDIVVSRSMFDRFKLVEKVVRAHHIPLILESCECYDEKTFGSSIHKIRFYQFRKCWNNTYNLADGYIAISRYLTDHYSKLNKPVVRIPAILDTERENPKSNDSRADKIKLIYSGDITGGKELMGDIFRALKKFESQSKIIFDIFGPSESQMNEALDENDKDVLLSLQKMGTVKVHGRIPQQEMRKEIEASDFGIFIRPKRISSEAGFPTKMGEYLSAGLPIITNNTGDVSLVIKHGVNGFIVEEPIEENLIKVFDDVLEMKTSQMNEMSSAARSSAIQFLDPKAYIHDICMFLDKF